LRQFLGREALLCGYPHPESRRWLAQDELAAQAFSAGSLCIAGSLPLLCGQLAASDLALDLLSESGWSLPVRLLVFKSVEELGALIRKETASGQKLMTSFPLSDETAPAEVHLVPPTIRSFLNNKKNLARLVPEDLCPTRQVLKACEILARPECCRDVVLKVATDGASGGGHDLLLPPRSGDAALVRALLDGAEEAVLEEFLRFRSTRCFNYFVDASGEVRFLGAPEQFLSGEGEYLGNWFRAGDGPGSRAVAAGTDICRQAAALGYIGAAGLDAGFLEDGSFRFFDLNFRMNGSTAPLILFPDLQRRFGASIALRTTLRGHASPRDLAAALRALLRERRFIPIAVALSGGEGGGEQEFLVSGFLPGFDKAEILESMDGLTRLFRHG
jgi:hypothetical protein